MTQTAPPPLPLSLNPAPRSGRGNGRLWGGLVLSLALHLALLGLGEPPREPLSTNASAPFQIRLVRTEPTADAVPPPSPSVAAPLRRPSRPAPAVTTRPPRQQPPAATPRVADRAPVPEPVSAPAAPVAAAAPVRASDEQALRQQLLPLLQEQLQRHFSYPPLARRRGWQGEVMLAFTLHPDGLISRRRIAHSSGHGLLDRAALAALEHVQRLSLQHTHTPPRSLEMELPVRYQLTEG